MSAARTITAVLLMPLLVTVIFVVLGVAACEVNKAYWDYRVRKWCAKDGGVKVYEYIELTQQEYIARGGKYGQLPMPIKRQRKSDDPYYLEFAELLIRNSQPQVRRFETRVVRSRDLKIMAELVEFDRGGGDFPTGISAPSGFSCRNVPGIDTDIGHVFRIQKEDAK